MILSTDVFNVHDLRKWAKGFIADKQKQTVLVNLISFGFNLKVIPVIDILNGVAVHAIRGERSNYKPLQSSLFKSADPVDVAGVFKTLGFRELYVADLDAIIDCSNDFHTLKGVQEAINIFEVSMLRKVYKTTHNCFKFEDKF